ncbi:hypothetical protein [Corynebacterium sp. Marseille-Q2823]|uniref:hypothetical protein n=1 Tax=Corynebacterium sp. Marseille-Q2823 TaxID=2736606 RepID=UPI00158DEF6E|nr:hypothetical protein [Corynebacterium sp. Marseille-Q2823]
MMNLVRIANFNLGFGDRMSAESILFSLDTDTAQFSCAATLLDLMDERAHFHAIALVAGNVGLKQQNKYAHRR